MPPGVVLLEEIGLLVAERDGHVRMVGRIDQRYPKVLLEGGIRPPAAILSIGGEKVADCIVSTLKRWRFPAPDDEVTVAYPFIFQPSG